MVEKSSSGQRPPEIFIDKTSWYKGPGGKFYATLEGLEAAREEWEKQFNRKNPIKEDLKKKPSKDTKPDKLFPLSILCSLSGLAVEQIEALTKFLASLLPPAPKNNL